MDHRPAGESVLAARSALPRSARLALTRSGRGACRIGAFPIQRSFPQIARETAGMAGADMRKGDIKKVVLAYSGGLDTSVILKWLQETYACEVIAFCADLGQGEDLQAIKAKAQKLGVRKVYVEDLRETFVKDYVFPMLRGNAMYEGCYLLGTSIARPLIARRQAEIALKEGAEAVAHGATGKGNDQVRFELTYTALAPNLKIIAPWREWTMRSRRELIEYADQHGIPITATKAKPYSMDLNLFHGRYEGGILEDPWKAPPDEIFQMTVSPEQAPDKPREIEIDYV